MFDFIKIKNKLNSLKGTNNRCMRLQGSYKVVAQENLLNFIQNNICILDVRTSREFRGVRVKNAINIPIDMICQMIDVAIPDKNCAILVYCMTGERTSLAIMKLNNLGYNNIYVWGNGGLNTLKVKEILEL